MATQNQGNRGGQGTTRGQNQNENRQTREERGIPVGGITAGGATDGTRGNHTNYPNDREITRENAIQIMNSRKLITGPGKYNLKVTSVVPFTREDNGLDTHIIGLAAMSSYHLSEAKRLAKEGQFQEATNQQMSRSQRNEQDYIPSKGEFVDVVVDYITNNDGIDILVPVSLVAMKTSKAISINFDLTEEDIQQAEPALV